ncbi:MAG TPA: hypothetical protein VFN25_07750 [Dokdonella sp.]|nr:hypothetical protein [Dokdonella sp.]HET9032782.1 hypothetical protein [Dokdonella sp.]
MIPASMDQDESRPWSVFGHVAIAVSGLIAGAIVAFIGAFAFGLIPFQC